MEARRCHETPYDYGDYTVNHQAGDGRASGRLRGQGVLTKGTMNVDR